VSPLSIHQVLRARHTINDGHDLPRRTPRAGRSALSPDTPIAATAGERRAAEVPVTNGSAADCAGRPFILERRRPARADRANNLRSTNAREPALQ